MGLEVRLIVHNFKPQLSEQLHPTRWPTNLYRDDEFKTCVQYFKYRCVKECAHKIPYSDVPLTSKNASVAQGIVAGAADEWSFKEGTTKIVNLQTQPVMSAKKTQLSNQQAKVKGGATKAAIKATQKAKKGTSIKG
jgi:hypothetical protein